MKRKHAFIPDTQVKPGVPTAHLTACGNYLADKRPDVIVMIGDWWDFPSLSSYDTVGAVGWEDKSLLADLEAGRDAMADMLRPIRAVSGYRPRMEFFMGNHEDRLRRAREDPLNRRFAGFLSDSQLGLKQFGWTVNPFLKIKRIDGILYSHYFINPRSLMNRPLAGSIENKLDKLGSSFSMGHQQTMQIGSVFTATGERRRGLVCGAFYEHEEEYLGPQKNSQHWRGMVMKHEVHAGDYDMMEVSLPYLKENWL